MKRPGLVIAIGAATLLGVWVVFAVSRSVYFAPRAERLAEIDRLSERVDQYRRTLEDQPRVARAVQEALGRTLGAELEAVDHRLRSRLNRIAEQLQIEGAAVGTGRATRRLSPAKSQFRGRFRELREEVDFVELDGWISGQATLEGALRLVDAIHREAWLKRITQIKLDARDNGARFAVTVRLVTLFVPGRAPETVDRYAYDPAGFAPHAALALLNSFRVPAPATPPVIAEVVPEPEPTPAFPYDQWMLTGVATTAAGPEIWLLNDASGESRRLAVGQRLEDAVFMAVEGDRATFALGPQEVEVAVGERINDRSARTQ